MGMHSTDPWADLFSDRELFPCPLLDRLMVMPSTMLVMKEGMSRPTLKRLVLVVSVGGAAVVVSSMSPSLLPVALTTILFHNVRWGGESVVTSLEKTNCMSFAFSTFPTVFSNF